MTAIDYAQGPTLITSDYRKTALARAVPYAYYGGGAQGNGWYLPPDPDPESARIALRLFPQLQGQHPELVARAHQSALDYSPIDLATVHWVERPPSEDPWVRIETHLQELRDAWHPPLVAPISTHPFQRFDADYAIDRLNRGKGAYLGWEMGLGKTLGACMVIDGWPANFIFIACPNDAKQDPWVDELARFCPWITPVVVGNTAKSRFLAVAEAAALMDEGTPCAVICHYAAIPLIEGANKRGWKKLGRFDLKIADEGHLHKNKQTKFTAAFRRLDACGSLFLSGSVMSGSAEALFTPFQILHPKRYRSKDREWILPFFDTIDGDYGRIIVGPSMPKLPAFKAELGEMLVIRRAKDYLALPEPRIVNHELGLHPEQKRVYHALADELLAELPDGTIQTTTDGAALLTALRRTTGGVPKPCGCYPGGVDKRSRTDTPCSLVPGEPAACGLISTKVDKALSIIEGAGDSQLVVFAWHKALVREIHRRCLEANIPCGVVDGDVSKPKRDAAVAMFKRQGYRVLVATIATLSSAVNLQNASATILAEHSFDPVDNEQAIGRVFRQGQTAHGTVHHLMCKDTVDDLQVWPTQLTKSELRKLVLGV